jgi:hypothetical protein
MSDLRVPAPSFILHGCVKRGGNWDPHCCAHSHRHGEMAERSKAHAWKACIRDERIEGSNPSLSARNKKARLSGPLRLWRREASQLLGSREEFE